MFLIRVLLPLHKVKSLSVYHPQVRAQSLRLRRLLLTALTPSSLSSVSVLRGSVPGEGQQPDGAGESFP